MGEDALILVAANIAVATFKDARFKPRGAKHKTP
jgi:hypothetical protein